MERTVQVTLDGRRRTSLAKVGRAQDQRYLAETFDDGTIVLSLATTVSAVELAALSDPALREVLGSAQHTPRSDLRQRGSFAEYAINTGGNEN